MTGVQTCALPICTLIDIEHSAAEALWLPQVAAILSAEAGMAVSLSQVRTAAWSD